MTKTEKKRSVQVRIEEDLLCDIDRAIEEISSSSALNIKLKRSAFIKGVLIKSLTDIGVRDA